MLVCRTVPFGDHSSPTIDPTADAQLTGSVAADAIGCVETVRVQKHNVNQIRESATSRYCFVAIDLLQAL